MQRVILEETSYLCANISLQKKCRRTNWEQKIFMWYKCAFKTDGKIRTAFAFRTIDGISGNLSHGSRCV